MAQEPMSFSGEEPEDIEIGVCVTDIQRRSGVGQSTTSQHLAMLRQAGLVVATRRGKWTYCRRNEANIARLLDTLREVFRSQRDSGQAAVATPWAGRVTFGPRALRPPSGRPPGDTPRLTARQGLPFGFRRALGVDSAGAFVVATRFLAIAADGHRAPAGAVGATAVE